VSGLPDALVFDFDGLILDTESSEFHSVAAVYDAHGLELVLEEWHEIVGTADHPHWGEVLEQQLGRSIDDMEALRQQRMEVHHELIEDEVVRPGVVALLDEADAAGVGLAVASSSPREWVEGHLDRLGLLRRFGVVRTRDDVTYAKPDPELYQTATAALGVDARSSVAFEDSRHGVTAAKAAGLVAVACPNPITEGMDLSHADLVVASLAEVTLARLGGLLPRLGR
jgi:HAD superfamily hydrolase (TIGR01509 family)